MGRQKKRLSTKAFVKQCLERGVYAPSDMASDYNELYGLKDTQALTSEAFTMAMRRMGISAKERVALKHEGLKDKDVTDITEYSEVQTYLGFSDMQQISQAQKGNTLKYLRTLWGWMGKTNPKLWEFRGDSPKEFNLIECLKTHIGQDDTGQWRSPDKVLRILGSFNRCFQGILPKGWSMGLKRPAGELKDVLEIDEYEEFESNLVDTPEMSREGWVSCYSAQINMGAREGTTHKGKSGVLGLRWEHIDFNTRRCKLRDKGKKGQPLRMWIQVPLDLFHWLHGWEKLLKWWEQCGKPRSGRVYPVTYQQYRKNFHNTRHACTCRIKENLETMRPHVFRQTHAQWGKRIGITLDNLCGDTKTYPHVGRYGVGWTDPKVLMQYYVSKEAWEYEEQDITITKRLQRPLTELGFTQAQHTVREETPLTPLSI